MSKLNFWGLSLLTSLVCFCLHSQTQAGFNISPSYKTKLSNEYYTVYDKTLALEISLDQKTPVVKARSEKEKTYVGYIANNTASIGLGVYYNWITLTTSIQSISWNSKFGKSQSFNFENRIFISKKFSTYFRYSTNKGFYLSTSDGFDPEGINFKIERENTNSKLIGGYIYYFPNGKRYSFKSLFNPLEVQLRRAGSPVINFFLVHNSINSPLPLLPNSSSVSSEVNYSRLIIGLSGGYGYNYIAFKRIYLSGIFTAGANYSINRGSEISSNENVGINTYFLLGGGYNNPSIRAGVSFFSHSLTHLRKSNDTSTLSYSDTSLRFHFSYRFDVSKKKVFKKIDDVLLLKFLNKTPPKNSLD